MKAACYHQVSFLNRPWIARPNAASRRYVLNKLIDNLLIGVSIAGIVLCVLFLITLC